MAAAADTMASGAEAAEAGAAGILATGTVVVEPVDKGAVVAEVSTCAVVAAAAVNAVTAVAEVGWLWLRR